MNHPAHVELVEKLLRRRTGAAGSGVRVGEVPALEYSSQERFLAERERIFARLPVPAAHESELAETGACLAVDVAGVPLLLVRGEDGVVRAFRNACRHRSTRLVSEQTPCRKKAIVCPYHAWTYDLAGRLVHAPHHESFRGEEQKRSELVPAHVASAAGLLWASLAPFDADEHLGPIASELRSAAQGWTLFRRSSREVRGNWKLIVDAFLDGYHIRHLHRDTVYRFFVDALYEAEPVGRHIRAATARRSLLEIQAPAVASIDVRQIVTPSYLLFPSTIVIVHPDYTSVLLTTPLSVDRSRFEHLMLIPTPPRTKAEEEHWNKSFALIDDGVFVSEDLRVVEAMQRGIESGANETLLVGELEHAVLWFHEALGRALA